MKFADALKEMLHRARLTQKGITEKAGYKSVSIVTAPIARGDIKISTLTRLANAAGYDVMLVRRDAVEPEYPIRIDFEEK